MRTLTFLAVLLTSAEGYRLVDGLFSENASTRRAAREKLIASGDMSIAPALVEVVFFSRHGRGDAVLVLEKLLGEKHGSDFGAWVEAIGWREDIVPKPGYIDFKSRQYARIDPAFSAFLQETHPRSIRARLRPFAEALDPWRNRANLIRFVAESGVVDVVITDIAADALEGR